MAISSEITKIASKKLSRLKVAETHIYRSIQKKACVIAHVNSEGHRVLFKNRDRNYSPELKIYHTISKGVEIVYMKDENTGWVEGVNEFGIGLVNSALMVLWDEKEGSKGKKKGEGAVLGAIGSKDARRILRALECKTLEEAMEELVSFEGGIRGHTIVSDGLRAFSLEHTAKHAPYFQEIAQDEILVRSNHGSKYPDAGYTLGENAESSKRRMQITLDTLPNLKIEEIAPSLYSQKYVDMESPFNVVRKTDNMYTSSQILLDLKNKKMVLYIIPEEASFLGVDINSDIESPVCSFEVKEFSFFDEEGGFEIKDVIY
jgi:hypothetical protein